MQNSSGTIKAYLLKWILIFSALGFLVIFVIASHAYTSSIRDNANEVAERVARQTFNSMYLVMSQGWTRAQLHKFLSQMERENQDSDLKVTLYRAPIVDALFGTIDQPPLDDHIHRAIDSGETYSEVAEMGSRFLYPLQARGTCIYCHTNAREGQTLGVIEVHQELEGAVSRAKNTLVLNLLLIAPLPLLLGFIAVRSLTRRVDRSIGQLNTSIQHVESVSDLSRLEREHQKFGFDELGLIYKQVGELAAKLRNVAVDKELLEFEIRLLEKFVITSEVVRDWRE